MKKILFLLVLTLTFGLFPTTTYAISARSAIVIDANSGRILYEHNKDEKRGMASTTKIMTALCALEYGDMEKTVTISSTASGVEGSSMYLAKGEKISMGDLVSGLMLVSGNDAATAIAESVSGSLENFALLMNKKASELGCFNTNFTNPHGLSDENHYTTAHDLAKITAYAMKNEAFSEIVKTKKKTLPKNEEGYQRTLINHNKFLSMYEGCIGVKTGFTKATGRCLVTAVEKNGMRLICVTLNAPDDWSDHRVLFDTALEKFSLQKIVSSDEVLLHANVKNGSKSIVTLSALTDLYLPVKVGEENKIEITTEPFEDLSAPIKSGEVLGKIVVKIDGNTSGEFPLVAKEDIEVKKTIFKPEATFAQNFKKFLLAWIACFQ